MRKIYHPDAIIIRRAAAGTIDDRPGQANLFAWCITLMIGPITILRQRYFRAAIE